EAARDEIDGFVPARLRQLAIPAHQRPHQAVGGVGVMVDKAPLVADPDFVDHLILAGHDALDHAAAARASLHPGTQRRVAANRAMRADTGDRSELPGARLEAEIHRRQRADRAYVGGVAAEDTVEARIAVGDDLQPATPVMEGNHRIVHDLSLEASAART